MAECCMVGQMGAKITLPGDASVRLDARLFGESASRIVLSASPEDAARIQRLAADEGAPVCVLGEAGGDELIISAEGGTPVALKVAEMEQIWRDAIPSLME